MKQIVSKGYLFGLLLSVSLLVWIVGIVNWVWIEIDTSPSRNLLHRWRLHSLFLWTWEDQTSSWIQTTEKNLDILKWLIIWKNSEKTSDGSLIVIWWGKNNEINGNNAWIWWWMGNTIRGDNSVIWWGRENVINGDNGVIVWWFQNKASDGIVIWWYQNNDGVDGRGIVLWGRSNKSNWENSLVLWYRWNKGTIWWDWSFVWNNGTDVNNKAVNQAARIETSSMLIWAYDKINGVKLVVSWAIKLWEWISDKGWEISVNSTWCINAYDWNNSHILGKNSEDVCGAVFSGCQFGNVILQHGETAKAYRSFYSTNCEHSSNVVTARCDNGTMNPNWYLYCYPVDAGYLY